MREQIPSYSQRDAAWASHKINGTSSTLGNYGCTISCIANVYTATGDNKNPKQMEELMRANGAFQRDLVLWTKVSGFVFRFYCTDKPAPMTEIKRYLDERKPVLLNVSFEKNTSKPNHWVLATGYDGDTIFINDPWYGDKTTVAPRYGKTSAIAILGGAYFNRVVPLPQPKVDEKDALRNELQATKSQLDDVRHQLDAKNAVVGELEGRVVSERLIYEERMREAEGKQRELQSNIEKLEEELGWTRTEWNKIKEQLIIAGQRIEELEKLNDDYEQEPTVPVVEETFQSNDESKAEPPVVAEPPLAKLIRVLIEKFVIRKRRGNVEKDK